MANNKNRRVQTPKPVRSRSRETMELQLQHRGGTHKAKTAYQRKPKHGGWA